MPTLADILYKTYGAWRLLRLDTRGMAYFDGRIETFWQSFFAAVLCAPGYLLLVLGQYRGVDSAASGPAILAIETIGYVIGWTAFPLTLFYVAQAIDRAARFTLYIVAFNWAKVIQILLYLPVALADLTGLLSEAAGQFLFFVVALVCLGYDWFIARTALAVPGLVAAGVVGLDLALSVLISMTVIRMTY